jgi:hypothetical protein
MDYTCTFWEPVEPRIWKTDRGDIVTEENDPHDWRSKSPIYRNVETGEEADTGELPVGAILDWAELGERYQGRAGADGRYLVCKMPEGPGHFWHIDGRASNCTLPDDDEHRCWVREGEVPKITAGKEGNTCAAGAGSIQTPTWHGFLRNGVLEEC